MASMTVRNAPRHLATLPPVVTSALFMASVLLASPSALAYRPFDGTDADVAHPGEFELEIGPAYTVSRGLGPGLALPSIVLNQGLLAGWELVVDGRNDVSLDRAPGSPMMRVDDVDVQLKCVLL